MPLGQSKTLSKANGKGMIEDPPRDGQDSSLSWFVDCRVSAPTPFRLSVCMRLCMDTKCYVIYHPIVSFVSHCDAMS